MSRQIVWSLGMFCISCVMFLHSPLLQAADFLNPDAGRHGKLMKKLLEPVVEQSQHLAVSVDINRKHVVPGTIIDSQEGICVAKASLLEEFASAEDVFRFQLFDQRWVSAFFLGYQKEHDLVFCPASDLTESVYRKFKFLNRDNLDNG